MMRDGEPLARIKMLSVMKDENDQSVNFYRDFCDENKLPKNDDALMIIGASANMGVAYGLQDALTDNNISLEDAKAISECMDKICEAVGNPEVNVKYVSVVQHDDGTTSSYDTHRFNTHAMEYYVEDIVGNLYDKYDLRHKPESLKTLVNDFINDAEVNPETGVPVNNCISAYYDKYKDKYEKVFAAEKVEPKDYECVGVDRLFSEPTYDVHDSFFGDGEPFVSSNSHKIGFAFNIKLSDQMADKLGVYHDEEFKPMIQYVTSVEGESPEINVCSGVKRVDEIERSVGRYREIVETITGSHMDRDYISLNDSNGQFTKSQMDGICSIAKKAMSENYPGFTLDADVVKTAVPAPEKPSKDRTKTAEAEFGGIQSGAESSFDNPNFK